MTDLRECPNPECGSTHIEVIPSSWLAFVQCGECGMEGPRHYEDEWCEAEAIRLWNLLPRRSDVQVAYKRGVFDGALMGPEDEDD